MTVAALSREVGKDGLLIADVRSVVTYERDRYSVREDKVASEYALTIYVNDQEFATVVCTPDYLEDMVIGFLASEGVIKDILQLRQLLVNRRSGTVRVSVDDLPALTHAFYNKRYIGSCCGKSRQSFYFQNDAYTARKATDSVHLTARQVFALMDRLDEEASLFRETGGVHIAGLGDVSGDMLTRSDIGRHNALDKLYGHALREGISLAGKVVTFSGRLSSEVLLKVAKIGVAVVLCKSAPTALALDMAQELNLTTVGFVRSGSFNVYTNAWRIEG
ncbi:MAG: formate dehydrogenase accessory sulfurtransferase FdhD [Firmicutes bacterium]|nr:formate dehydrogenase accessory sulfurtransferase FdhD [Bacillota bacterium]